MSQALITVLLKTNKNYIIYSRPISLLNVDVKILAEILATCLEKILPSIILEEQNGFIKIHQWFFKCLYASECDFIPMLLFVQKLLFR